MLVLAAQLIEFLMSPAAQSISGRLLSARFDREILQQKTSQISQDSNYFRLRRIDHELYSPNLPAK
jgi:hypothetical protein